MVRIRGSLVAVVIAGAVLTVAAIVAAQMTGFFIAGDPVPAIAAGTAPTLFRIRTIDHCMAAATIASAFVITARVTALVAGHPAKLTKIACAKIDHRPCATTIRYMTAGLVAGICTLLSIAADSSWALARLKLAHRVSIVEEPARTAVFFIAMPPHKELKGHGEPRQECDQGHDDRAPTSQRHVGCEWVEAGARRAPRAAA
jgi:hypothetical protein